MATPVPAAAWPEVCRALRRGLGMAQEDLAAMLEVSRKTVQRWEAGEAVPGAATEARLVDFCASAQVFERVERGALHLGVASEPDLRDLLAESRQAHGLRATDLVGRDADVSVLRRRLADHRQVTVIGPAGVGKTALATSAAGPGSVVVRLDTIDDAGLVPDVIADELPGPWPRAVGVRTRPSWCSTTSSTSLPPLRS